MSKAKGFGKKPQGSIYIESLVAQRNGQPYVRLKWGKETTQFTVQEAIAHAAAIIQVAAASVIDAQIFEWSTKKIGSSPEQAAQLMGLFRLKRQSTNPPGFTINVDGDQMRPESIRESACEMIELTFFSEAESYLVSFLLEELQMEPGAVDIIIQDFREMRGAETLWEAGEDADD